MPMMEIKFEKEKEYLNKCVDAFNLLCERDLYPDILEFTPYDLYTHHPQISITLWKTFHLDPTISKWYAEERVLILRSQVNKLIREAGSSKSTASAQALSTLLKQLNEQTETSGSAIIIYNFIPLTEEEKKGPIPNENKDVPSAIGDAIQVIQDNSFINSKK